MTFQPDYTGIIRAVDKNFRLTSSQMDAVTRRSTALSTGLLVTDLIMGSGGILPGGMYTFFGKEAAAKSTHSYHILDAAVQAGIPLITVWDYEKSMDPTYLQGITEGRLKADDVFGTLDGKGGWAIEPKVRYYDEVLGITFFDSMSSLLRNLPDKRLVGDDWFYVWPNTKANQKTLSGHYNKSLFSKTNEFWIEAPNGNMQALLFVDSWQGMMAEEDEEDNASKGMALEARMFSRQLKRVKSKLRIKSAALIGVNQYRKAPAVQYGCFPYDAQVLLADGTTLSIGHIVDNKLEIDVVSYNRRTGKCEPKPIINWFNNGKAESKDFLSFVLSDKDGVRRRLLRPTPGHFLMNGGSLLQPASTFRNGDTLLGTNTTRAFPLFSDFYPKPVTIDRIDEGCALHSDTSKWNKYDIEVGDNHLYVVDGVIVENSPDYEPGGESLKFWCMSGDTLLFTDKGIQRADKVNQDRIFNISGIDGEEKASTFRYMGHHPTTEITTQYGYNLRGRHEHRVLAMCPGVSKPDWVSLSELTKNHYVGVKVGANVWSKSIPIIDFEYKDDGKVDFLGVTLPKEWSIDLSTLCGYLMNRCRLENDKVIIPVSQSVLYILDTVVELLIKVFVIPPVHIIPLKVAIDSSHTTEIILRSIKLYHFCKYLGLDGNFIPRHVLESPFPYVKGFVSAMFELHTKPNSFTSRLDFLPMSYQLVRELHLILLNAGVISNFNGRNIRSCGTIDLEGQDLVDWSKIFGYVTTKKQKWVNNLISAYDLTYLSPKQGLKIERHLWDNEFYNWASRNTQGYIRYDAVTPEMQADFRKYVETLKSNSSKIDAIRDMELILDLVKKAKEHSIVWLPIMDSYTFSECVPVYDGNMSKTHTIVTNGIVSHNSDFRLKQAPRAIPHGKGQVEEEDSVIEDGATDLYKYIHVQSIKNKYGTPYLDGWHRIWFEDHDGNGRGFCPVWDTFQFLRITGQIVGNMKKMKLTLKGFPLDTSLSWYDFKSLILLKGEKARQFCNKLGITRPPKIRDRCFAQIKDGSAHVLRVEEKRNKR